MARVPRSKTFKLTVRLDGEVDEKAILKLPCLREWQPAVFSNSPSWVTLESSCHRFLEQQVRNMIMLRVADKITPKLEYMGVFK